MFDYTTENVLNDLSRVSVIDDTAVLAGPAVTATIGAGGTLANGAYFYKVTAINAQGESTPGAEGTDTSASTNHTMALTWTAVTGATGYRVYRGTVTNTENKLIGSPTTNSFSDTGITGVTQTPPTTNTAGTGTDGQVPTGDKALFIKRLNKYLKSNAGRVWRRVATSPVNEVATIALPATANTGGVYRLSLDVTMSGSYPIDYDRWAINKGKPFYVEALVATGTYTDAQLVAILAPLFIKGLKKYNGQNITDVVPAAATGSITVTAANEYMRFKGAIIEKSATDGESWTTIATGTVTTSGVEGFGTAWFITKNLRIPTQEATRFYGLDQDERPVNGVLYNQYTFQYDAARNFTGQGAVGQTIRSKTTHVLYIPSTLATTFEASITSAFGAGTIFDAQSKLAVN